MKINIGKYPKKGERKVSIHIDDFDVWNLDHTLALIIHPALMKLKEIKHGSPFVDDEDVPEKLKSTSAKSKKNNYDVDSNHHKRWDYVLNEMIFAFDSIANNNIKDDDRIKNGLRLFSKYYFSLWD